MEFSIVRWRIPAHCVVKVIMHRFFFDEALPNENRSGIGVIICNLGGRVLMMYCGTLSIEERRTNEDE